MPWCPNCRNEYKKGISKCADCNVQLVNELAPINDLVAIAGLKEEASVDKFINFLASEKIEGVKEYSDEDEGFIISVIEKHSKKAKKLFEAFYTVELESIISKKLNNELDGSINDDIILRSENDIEDILTDEYDNEYNIEENYDIISNNNITKDVLSTDDDGMEVLVNLRQAASSAYVKKADKSKDLKSTAVTFIFFGVIGVVFTILNILGYFSFFDNLLSYIVMGIVFIGCILIGIMSYKDSKKADKEAVEEEEFSKIINEWLKNNINDEFIKSYSNPENTSEVNFLTIIEEIKKAVITKFGEIDEAYLDNIVEEYYNTEFDI